MKSSKAKYWFADNWYGHGLLHEFLTLREAKKAAKKQTGMSVAIYSYKPHKLVCLAPASGYTPP